MEIDVDRVQGRLTETLGYTDTSADAAVIAQCASDAAEMVKNYIGKNSVPESIAVFAAVEVARELHTRLSAPGGVLSPFGDSAPVRLARDPLKAAYPILQPYMAGGFA